MPLHVGVIETKDEYVLYYQKAKESIAVASPNKDEAKDLFQWLKAQVFP